MTGRHSALGDATAAAKIFQKLVPLLRNRGIRTLGEAIRATASLRQLIDEQLRAGWTDVSGVPADPFADLGPRIDTYPYRHRVREIMSSPPRFVSPQATLATVIAQIAAEKISSVYVHAGDGAPRPGDTGIVTERDMLRMLAARGSEALGEPVALAMSKPLAVVDADSFAYVAIGRMNRLGVRHLGVVDEPARWSARCRRAISCACARRARPCSATTSVTRKARPSWRAPGRACSRLPPVCCRRVSPAAISRPSSPASSAR